MFKFENNFLISDEPGFDSKPFLSKEILNDPKFTLYVYAEMIEEGQGKYPGLHLKFGETFEKTVWNRYAEGTGNTQMKRMIAVWASEKRDKPEHRELQLNSQSGAGYIWDGEKTNSDTNSEESYYIPDIQAFNEFFEDLEDYIEVKAVTKEPAPPLYPEIADAVQEFLSFLH